MASTGAELNNKFLEDLPVEQRSEKGILLKADQVTSIGNLSEFSHTRKLTINFNNLGILRGLDQFPQLRKLSAYCCALRSLEDLGGNKRIETLSLQQNYIKELAFCLRSMQKLKKLRVDKNELTTIENLQSCTSLRYLDLSYNKIESLEGIAGLQCLSELKVTNNKLRSLRGLSALPSLLEMHVDNNMLTSLAGIQNIPTLEILHASNNQITTLLIPQTYTHTGSLVRQGSAIAAKGKQKDTSSVDQSTVSSSNANSKPKLGMANLTELELSGNMIESLDGLGTLGDSIETLDLSNNQLNNLEILEALTIFPNLKELYVRSNPLFVSLSSGVREGHILKSIAKLLLPSCKSLDYLDGFPLQSLIEKGKTNADRRVETDLFKTWDNNASEVDPNDTIFEDASDSDSDLEMPPREQLEALLESQKVLSKEEIEATENVFKNLLFATKDILRAPLSSLDLPVKKAPFVRTRPSMLRTTVALASTIEQDKTLATVGLDILHDGFPLNEAEAFVINTPKVRTTLATDENATVTVTHAVSELSIDKRSNGDSHRIDDMLDLSPRKSARPFSANDSLGSKSVTMSTTALENKSSHLR
jgi:Leucine-rich repeat (LRR) protein